MASSEQAEEVYRDVLDTRVTNYVAFIGYTILVWDHLITFDDEVRYVWHGHWRLVIYLFFFNRYYIPLAFIGNFVAYFSDWSPEYCNKFARFEGVNTAIGVCVAGAMMLMRVRALYADRPRIIQALVLLLLVEAGVFVWLLTRAQAVEHTPAVKACTMIFDPALHFFPSLSAWIPLVFDTIAILLTLYRCALPVWEKTAGYILLTLLKDGLLYYSVILCVNITLAIMIISTRDDIKNITAQLELLLTVAMMSRITLNLRRKALGDPSSDDEEDSYLYPRSISTQSFPDFDSRHRLHHHSDWGESTHRRIELATWKRNRPEIYDSRTSSPWTSHRYEFDVSRDSFDSDSLRRSRSRSVVSRPASEAHEHPSEACYMDRDDQLHDTDAALELRALPEPDHAVLTDRGVAYELESMRASPFIRH